MRVLVSGATGYVGRAVVERLLADGHEVFALVRSAARATALPASRVLPRVHTVIADLTRDEPVLPPGLDAVIHLASSLFPASDRRVNVDGSRRVLRAAQVARVRKFVFTSSSLVYGPGDPDSPVDESAPCRPHLRFSRQQRELELDLLRAAEEHGFPAVILLRPLSEIWGGQGGFFDDTVERLRRGQLYLANVPTKLSLTELSDLVEVIARSLEAELAPGEVFNVCTPVAVPTSALYDALADVLGVAPPRRLSIPLIFAVGGLLELGYAFSSAVPPFNLEIARLAGFLAGTRQIDEARRLLGFEPRCGDPMTAIVDFYRARGDALTAPHAQPVEARDFARERRLDARP